MRTFIIIYLLESPSRKCPFRPADASVAFREMISILIVRLPLKKKKQKNYKSFSFSVFLKNTKNKIDQSNFFSTFHKYMENKIKIRTYNYISHKRIRVFTYSMRHRRPMLLKNTRINV